MALFKSYRREMRIKKLLQKFARQRVYDVMQPGDIWVVENAVNAEHFSGDFQTCLLRGWLEIFDTDVPHNSLNEDGSLPDGPMFTSEKHIYKLTGSGWDVINNSRGRGTFSLLIALISLIIAAIALMNTQG